MNRGDEIVTRVIKSRAKMVMRPLILQHVSLRTTLSTDEFGGCKDIDQSG